MQTTFESKEPEAREAVTGCGRELPRMSQDESGMKGGQEEGVSPPGVLSPPGPSVCSSSPPGGIGRIHCARDSVVGWQLGGTHGYEPNMVICAFRFIYILQYFAVGAIFIKLQKFGKSML